jgi:DNA modification methylase
MKERKKSSEKLQRLDLDGSDHERVLPYCRLKHGETWEDPVAGHRVGVLDCTSEPDVRMITAGALVDCVINDPPYNVKVGNANTAALFKVSLAEYIEWSRCWVTALQDVMAENSHLFIWLGADYKDNFQPLPDIMILMREFEAYNARNFVTLRNQRGYGTQKNWMWVRQELLHYVKGNPGFKVVYTDIPKILKGYYKSVGGKITDNIERSRSDTIRPGNVWVDIQQVFYRREENVPGCYAQKPLKAIERIIETSSPEGGVILDGFAHSGTTLMAGELLGRRVFTMDIDPVYAELTIRRLERYRETGKTGWQWNNPFPEIDA